MWGGVIAFLTALPSMISLLGNMWKASKKFFGDSPKKFMAESNAAFKQLANAETTLEKTTAAMRLQRLLKRL